ncbi:hypothetical protein [Mucilaginibacter aquatilis]|uniref:Lipoprotein n=1 Tax=Mucilaginibacter aquatilis TaxID=1517760 RepID=A0A6I4I5E1_9SPHI|nr:hypothetical protein [Mucilaginibacter aquatilis]MVN90262.1 hypothetical protein [Mucilaginibacter aquatilis]
MRSIYLLGVIGVLMACNNKKPTTIINKDSTTISAATTAAVNKPQLHTDTLQYIHFDGNYDYWFAVFIDKQKDTLQLVVDDAPNAKFRNKLVQVTWFTDTLTQAGDNESKYAGKRLKSIHPITGKAFIEPVTEQKVIKDIEALPEVKSNADKVSIAERPTDDREYYLVETGTHNDDNFSRLFMFRVYVYPEYEIKFYDINEEKEMSLDEWRKNKQ